jgi:hypothetical protein
VETQCEARETERTPANSLPESTTALNHLNRHQGQPRERKDELIDAQGVCIKLQYEIIKVQKSVIEVQRKVIKRLEGHNKVDTDESTTHEDDSGTSSCR